MNQNHERTKNFEGSGRESERRRVYIFVDGPNYYESCKDNFQINLTRLKTFVQSTYGDVKKFMWYDLKADIPYSDIETVVRSNPVDSELEKMISIGEMEKSEDSEEAESKSRGFEELIDQLIADKEQLESILKRYARFRKSIVSYQGRKRFLHAIRNLVTFCLEDGFILRSSCVACGEDVYTKTEKGITDFNLSNDMIYSAARDDYDSAFLVTGDGHYVKSVNYVKNLGKRVIVGSFKSSLNKDLEKVADRVLLFDKHHDELKM